MATTKFYLDKRSGDAPYPLKLTITHERKAVHLSMGVKINPEQWDGSKIIKHPRAQMLNAQLAARKAEIDCLLIEWQRSGKLRGASARTIKAMIDNEANVEAYTVGRWFANLIEQREGRTRKIYVSALNRVRRYEDVDNMSFEELTPEWLQGFDRWMVKNALSPNARATYMRCLRAVVNNAINNDITAYYGFRRFKVKTEETVKRSLSLEQMRTLMNCKVPPCQEIYRDMFVLMILLRGINIGDLCLLKKEDVVNGRIVYRRQKTHVLYSVKIEPEAQQIIDRYRGERHLIYICDRSRSYESLKTRMNFALKKIGMCLAGEMSLSPKLSTYWARHTFASIAYNDCGMSMDVISDMLGHSNGLAVTNVYVRRNERVIDEAARKVIDKIMYNK